jgi:hypothetical protein
VSLSGRVYGLLFPSSVVRRCPCHPVMVTAFRPVKGKGMGQWAPIDAHLLAHHDAGTHRPMPLQDQWPRSVPLAGRRSQCVGPLHTEHTACTTSCAAPVLATPRELTPRRGPASSDTAAVTVRAHRWPGNWDGRWGPASRLLCWARSPMTTTGGPTEDS